MLISKSAQFQKIEEFTEALTKAKKKDSIQDIHFNGHYNKHDKSCSFNLTWTEEEEI